MPFWKTTDNHEDGVERVGSRELCDKVEGYVLPRRFWRLQWHERSVWTRVARLGDLALWTRADVVENVGTKLWAKEMFLDECVHFVEARMASKF